MSLVVVAIVATINVTLARPGSIVSTAMVPVDRTFDLANAKTLRITTDSLDVHLVPLPAGAPQDGFTLCIKRTPGSLAR